METSGKHMHAKCLRAKKKKKKQPTTCWHGKAFKCDENAQKYTHMCFSNCSPELNQDKAVVLLTLPPTPPPPFLNLLSPPPTPYISRRTSLHVNEHLQFLICCSLYHTRQVGNLLVRCMYGLICIACSPAGECRCGLSCLSVSLLLFPARTQNLAEFWRSKSSTPTASGTEVWHTREHHTHNLTFLSILDQLCKYALLSLNLRLLLLIANIEELRGCGRYEIIRNIPSGPFVTGGSAEPRF